LVDLSFVFLSRNMVYLLLGTSFFLVLREQQLAGDLRSEEPRTRTVWYWTHKHVRIYAYAPVLSWSDA
jgi:hypothetical protein